MPTTNLYFVFYRSLEWDAICESCGDYGVLLKSEASGIKLNYYFILMCVYGCRDFGARDGVMEGSIRGRMWRR